MDVQCVMAVSAAIQTLAAVVVGYYAIVEGKRAGQSEQRFQRVLSALVIANCIQDGSNVVQTLTVDNIKEWLKKNPPEQWPG